ncbi:GNAT family N-acetyltransferase [Catenuloplanes atrovinosus]|uniref:GNAT superfamily N-acetyltransferase n=1 Tax=Catenuloplanes atrovinosus TaxID=137266 RepID=A0AAE3YNB7_9ACTN|nr:GNAT family N-acetyltransferase [Catenuloplanes atrovinosus]MDR7274941.1 GNAT superfamily N-acetyltransferase [Catenuloplanes atrovinosus]
MRIRPATIADAAVLADVHVRTWQATYRGFVPDGYLRSLDPVRWRPFWQDRLRRPEEGTATLALVPDAGDRPVGFVSFGPSRDDAADVAAGEIFAIYVLPEHWGTGGGRMLMAAALTALADAGFGRATLWVLDGNARARRFYEAGGWRPDGLTKRDESRGFPLDEVRYVLDLR